MNPNYGYLKTFILSILILAANIPSVQAKRFRPQVMPIPSQVQLMHDQQNIQELTAFAQHYSSQVNEYIIEINNEIEIIDAQKRDYLKQIQLLEKQSPRIAGAERTDLSALHAKINQGDLIKQQGIKNINTALAWQNYVRQQVNNARYGITQDQEQVASDLQLAQRVRSNQLQLSSFQRMENELNSAPIPRANDYDYGPMYNNRLPNERFNNGGGGRSNARGGGTTHSSEGGGGAARSAGGGGGGKH